tara:strand:+ start:135 stop:362 length:228 start_codon:yes stop_codon:yes gene_type:complete
MTCWAKLVVPTNEQQKYMNQLRHGRVTEMTDVFFKVGLIMMNYSWLVKAFGTIKDMVTSSSIFRHNTAAGAGKSF